MSSYTLIRYCRTIFTCALFASLSSLRAEEPPDHAAGLSQRLHGLKQKEKKFPAPYRSVYYVLLPWFEEYGRHHAAPVDAWMVQPEAYATRLADALETGHNFVADQPGSTFPAVFEMTTAKGKSYRANYLLTLPRDFGAPHRRFPLVIGLHGSGWLGHEISFIEGRHVSGRVIQVAPINQEGPWQIDFLNAFLDDLLAKFPIDSDHVYLEGHSLGGIATWEWATQNPERFAAISPRAGAGEPFRAIRLKYVPSWPIHGEDDDVIPRGFAEQMVSALQACGASVRYSVLSGVPHNMPDDLDEEQVINWYLQQTRSGLPPPPDPLAQLKLNQAGFSNTEIITLPASTSFKSGDLNVDFAQENEKYMQAFRQLFRQAEATGKIVDSPIWLRTEAGSKTAQVWLAAPKTLRAGEAAPAGTEVLPAHAAARFYFRGSVSDALKHATEVRASLEHAGSHPTNIGSICSKRVTPGGG